MESNLYYTFSTIAQTLAAAIALLAAFALYRLQGLAEILAATSLRIEEAFVGEDHGTYQSLRVAARYSELRALMHEAEARADMKSEPVAARRRTFESALATASSVRFWLYISLSLTVAVVLLSLIVLSRTHYIAQLVSAPLVLTGGIVATAICLVAYVVLVRKAVA